MSSGLSTAEIMPGRHTRVARRRLQLVVPEQRLDRPDIDPAIVEMRREAVPQRMHVDRLPDARRLPTSVEDVLSWWVVSGRPDLRPGNSRRSCTGTPASRRASAAPSTIRATERAISGDSITSRSLRPFDCCDVDDHLRAVDVLDLEPDDFAGAQAGAVAEAQHQPVAQAPAIASSRFASSWTQDQRNLLRLLEVENLGRQIVPAQRDAEQEAQPGHGGVARHDANAGLGQMELEQPDLVGRRRIGRALQPGRKSLVGA